MRKTQDKSGKKLTRRELLKTGGLAAMTAAVIPKIARAKSAADGKRLAMVIDLQRCTACGGCIIACITENNLQTGVAWSYKISKTVGVFPNVRYEYLPTLCNHCEKAPCVQSCPTGAMHKGYGNITMHNPNICIGCKTCKAACPYGVIFYNKEKPHKFWKDSKALMDGITSSPQEVTEKAKGTVVPYYNAARENSASGTGLRDKGVVEKCTLCDHRIKKGQLPYCVEACPADARIFGDLNDPNSAVSKLLRKYRPFRLKEHLGTEPKVFYVRSLNPGNYQKTKGSM